jgi:hypothetical protein
MNFTLKMAQESHVEGGEAHHAISCDNPGAGMQIHHSAVFATEANCSRRPAALSENSGMNSSDRTGKLNVSLSSPAHFYFAAWVSLTTLDFSR